jgi:probable HAF family extracellular repeat protein
MKITCGFKVRNLMLAAVLVAGVGFVTHAAALERSYLIDLEAKTMADLGTLGGGSTTAYDMNDAGQVVGYSITSGGVLHAFMTGANGMGIRDLGELFAGKDSLAHGINDAGRVVVVSDYRVGNDRSFITGPNGVGMTGLASLSGGDSRTRATDINNAGQVVGWSDTGMGAIEAFITGPNGEDMRYLGGGFSQAWGINEAGQVAGTVGDLGSRAFITGPNGEGMRVLGTLGGSFSSAGAINESGQVLGISTMEPDETWRPFITGPDGVGMRELSTLNGSRLFNASGINDAGQVAGPFSLMALTMPSSPAAMGRA